MPGVIVRSHLNSVVIELLARKLRSAFPPPTIANSEFDPDFPVSKGSFGDGLQADRSVLWGSYDS